MTLAAIWIGLGLIGGFLTGLLGLGGAMLFTPLLLLAPIWLESLRLSVYAVTTISLLYLLLAAGVAAFVRGGGRVDGRGVWQLTLVVAPAAFMGGLLSSQLSEQGLLLLSALAVTWATLHLGWPKGWGEGKRGEGSGAGPSERRPSRATLGLAAILAGLLTGAVGASSGFYLMPLLQRWRALSARRATATCYRVILISALAGLLGKGIANWGELGLAGSLLAGALPAAWWGGEWARKLSPRRLRWGTLLAAVGATLTLWWIALPGLGLTVRPTGPQPAVIDLRSSEAMAPGQVPGALALPMWQSDR